MFMQHNLLQNYSSRSLIPSSRLPPEWHQWAARLKVYHAHAGMGPGHPWDVVSMQTQPFLSCVSTAQQCMPVGQRRPCATALVPADK